MWTRRKPLKFMLEPDWTHGVVEPWVPPDGVALEVGTKTYVDF